MILRLLLLLLQLLLRWLFLLLTMSKMRRSLRRQGAAGVRASGISAPLEPIKDGHLIDPHERMFLEAAERGDKHTIIRCLQQGQRPPPVNVNCTDILGRTAIQVYTRNHSAHSLACLAGCCHEQPMVYLQNGNQSNHCTCVHGTNLNFMVVSYLTIYRAPLTVQRRFQCGSYGKEETHE